MLIQILYGARVARWDLLKATTRLAARVSKWTTTCDRELHRLICYIDSTWEDVLTGSMVNAISDINLTLYADADFAGDRPSYKSTSGMALFIEGSDSLFPIAAKSIKQTCRSHGG